MNLPSSSHPLPNRTYVTLTAAITWLRYDRALELGPLLAWAEQTGRAIDIVQRELTDTWRELSDYACRGTVEIRGRQVGSSEEIPLTLNTLRNCRHVGWLSPQDTGLIIDPFDFTFSSGFRSRGEPYLKGVRDVVVRRDHLMNYKKVRPRLKPAPREAWPRAQEWLRTALEPIERIPGLKIHCTQFMMKEFGITKMRANDLWTEIARSLNFPLHGRPTKQQKEKLPSILKGLEI